MTNLRIEDCERMAWQSYQEESAFFKNCRLKGTELNKLSTESRHTAQRVEHDHDDLLYVFDFGISTAQFVSCNHILELLIMLP